MSHLIKRSEKNWRKRPAILSKTLVWKLWLPQNDDSVPSLCGCLRLFRLWGEGSLRTWIAGWVASELIYFCYAKGRKGPPTLAFHGSL